MQDDFAALNTKLVGLSVDGLYSHIAWLRTIKEKITFRDMRDVEVTFPLIEDISMNVARQYGMIMPGEDSTKAVRFNDFWGRWTKTGVHGDPTKATAEKGKQILEIVMKHMLAWLDEYRTWPIETRSDQHRLPVQKDIRW